MMWNRMCVELLPRLNHSYRISFEFRHISKRNGREVNSISVIMYYIRMLRIVRQPVSAAYHKKVVVWLSTMLLIQALNSLTLEHLIHFQKPHWPQNWKRGATPRYVKYIPVVLLHLPAIINTWYSAINRTLHDFVWQSDTHAIHPYCYRDKSSLMHIALSLVVEWRCSAPDIVIRDAQNRIWNLRSGSPRIRR